MRTWFESLHPREKGFVATAAVLVVLALFWLAVWMPLDRGQESKAVSVDTWRRALSELRSLQDVLGSGGATRSAPVAAEQSLVVIVDTTLRSRDLYSALQRSTPNQENGIQLVFEDAAFDDLVLWLGDLSEQYGLRVEAAGFSPSGDAAGRVNGTVTLER
ncbi:MAG TPA: type II secretion system protein M [Woeseiaceae bacterium]|jgi:general secretion pathway protein M|nr:type II secretion system protein M [Woeseiaceae bacterium]